MKDPTMESSRFGRTTVGLLFALACSCDGLTPSVNRREAMQTAASLALGTASSGLILPISPSVAVSGTSIQPVATLSDGTKFPLASFGLQIYSDETAYELTLTALKVGYRNYFASVLAGNQKGFARAVKDSGIPREELFI